jgi:hypothetical protein
MKSFDIKFNKDGSVIIGNIQGIEGPACTDFTAPYVTNLEDKRDPAITVMDEEHTLYNKTEVSSD